MKIKTGYEYWRSPSLNEVLAPALRELGREEVTRLMQIQASALSKLSGKDIIYHNVVDSDCNAPAEGYMFFHARWPIPAGPTAIEPFHSPSQVERIDNLE